jgi:hypothetical protein
MIFLGDTALHLASSMVVASSQDTYRIQQHDQIKFLLHNAADPNLKVFFFFGLRVAVADGAGPWSDSNGRLRRYFLKF